MYGAPGRRWGWHSLSPEHAAHLVLTAQIRPGDLVLDIGAGTGEITAPLVESGAEVIAIELHPGRFERLAKRFEDVRAVRPLHLDARNLWLPRRPFKVVANPPFDLTAELIRLLTQRDSNLVGGQLVLERAAVRKLASNPARQPRGFSFEHAYNLPRRAFDPKPAVDIGVMRIKKNGTKRRRR